MTPNRVGPLLAYGKSGRDNGGRLMSFSSIYPIPYTLYPPSHANFSQPHRTENWDGSTFRENGLDSSRSLTSPAEQSLASERNKAYPPVCNLINPTACFVQHSRILSFFIQCYSPQSCTSLPSKHWHTFRALESSRVDHAKDEGACFLRCILLQPVLDNIPNDP